MSWRKLGKNIIYPPLWIIVLLVVVTVVALPLVFVRGLEETFVGYSVYVISFYAVVAVSAFFIKVLPKQCRKIKQKIYDNPLGNRYMTNVDFKVRVSLYISLTVTLIFSVFKLVSAVLYSSVWVGAEAVYYILLSLIRYLLLRFMHSKNEKQDMIKEYRNYRLSAVLMLFINLMLSVIVLNMILKNKTYSYSDTYVIASATYTFYTLTVSIVDIVRYRKYQSPVLSATKALRFATALVSLLSLETVMLIQFGDDESFRRFMTSVTGAGVFAVVLGMSVYMVIRANKMIKRIRSN